MATLKLHSNGPLYRNTAVDRRTVTFGTARVGLGGLGPTHQRLVYQHRLIRLWSCKKKKHLIHLHIELFSCKLQNTQTTPCVLINFGWTKTFDTTGKPTYCSPEVVIKSSWQLINLCWFCFVTAMFLHSGLDIEVYDLHPAHLHYYYYYYVPCC